MKYECMQKGIFHVCVLPLYYHHVTLTLSMSIVYVSMLIAHVSISISSPMRAGKLVKHGLYCYDFQVRQQCPAHTNIEGSTGSLKLHLSLTKQVKHVLHQEGW